MTFCCASCRVPALSTIPPTCGATNSTIAPSAWAAAISAWSSFASAPSLARMPSLRPLKLLGPFRMMLSGGEGGRSLITGRAGGAASGIGSSRSPSATFMARSSSTFRRLATMRARMAGVSTLLSSKTKASLMCVCSVGVWLR